MASTGLTPAKRRLALSKLGRERLNELTHRYALDVGDRRILDLHVDALVRSKAVDFAELLGSLKREELQALCQALGLSSGGREKDTLVQRILGGAEGQEAPPSPVPPKNGRKHEPPPQASLELPAAERLSVDQLERYLWSAADILRGSIDSSDYKNYIFGLLFLKRLSQLIVELLQPKEGMRISDPTCGSGGMLIECAKYVERHGGNPRNLTQMNLLLHGLADHRVEKGDTIRDPKLVQDGGLILYDRVIANPQAAAARHVGAVGSKSFERIS